MTWIWWISQTQVTLARVESNLIGQAGLCAHFCGKKAGEVIDSSNGFGSRIQKRKEEEEEQVEMQLCLSGDSDNF